jgi:electron transfer flavoprotein beta subunit
MKILVCIKQVPDMESRFRVNAAGTWYDTTELAWRLNEYDEYAVEQAVQLKEQLGGESGITVASVGPERAKEAIKKALAMGADKGVHIQDEQSYEKDPFAIASILAEYAQQESFDLILTGMQSQDRGSAQVGVLLAEMLGIPVVTTIVDFAFADGAVTVRRELEGGLKAVVKTRLPALFTCQMGLNTPRYPTLPNIMKAKKKELASLAVADLLKVEPVAATQKVAFPEKKAGGLVLEGDVSALAGQLLGILKEKTTVCK